MPDDWRQELMERYQDLFESKTEGRTFRSGYPSVGDGWRELLEKAIDRIATAVRVLPSARVKIVQIKEKFGGIRIYFDEDGLSPDVEAAVMEAIELAEARSTCTCESCGREAQLYNSRGWIAARCDKHAAEDAKALGTQLNVVKYGYVDGKWTIARRRRYDRRRDAFVDDESQINDGSTNDPETP